MTTTTDLAYGEVVVAADPTGKSRLHFHGLCTHFYDQMPPVAATEADHRDPAKGGRNWCRDCINKATRLLQDSR